VTRDFHAQPALRPARIEPIFMPRIWGAASLTPLFPDAPKLQKSSAGDLPIGEVWLTGDTCKFADGPFTGLALGEAWRKMPASWAGTRMDTTAAFPLLVKFLFPAQKLSVQVHPSDEYAREHEAASGGKGKTEIWYAVAAKPGVDIFVGLKSGITPKEFRLAIEDGTVEDCLNRVPVSAGDAIFVPAGTAHTIGPGLMLCEIQQNSDLTYRVYDYGRRNPDGTTRELHVEKAMAVINFGEQRGRKVRPARAAAHGGEIIHFVACKYFALEKWEFTAPIDLRTEPEQFELWIVIAGRGKISWPTAGEGGAGKSDFAAGQAWFVPAAQTNWRIEPAEPTIMLHSYVPDLSRYAAQLAACGITAEQIEAVVQR
jgi:mannose-6-phosphate isomerase